MSATTAPVSTKFIPPRLAWVDGQTVPYEKATVPLMSHSLHYGTAVFEGIRFYPTSFGSVIFRLEDHMQRLINSAAAISMDIPFTLTTLKEAARVLVLESGLDEGYIRPLCYYGPGLGVSQRSLDVHVAMVAVGLPPHDTSKGIRLTVADTRRLHPQTCTSGAKVTGHYFNSFQAGRQAQARGFDDALLLDTTTGCIAEASAANLFIVRGSTIVAARSESALYGITRETVIQAATNDRIAVFTEQVSLEDLREASEVFLTGTVFEVCPVAQVEGYFDGQAPGPITAHLTRLFRRIVTGEHLYYSSWLTPCRF